MDARHGLPRRQTRRDYRERLATCSKLPDVTPPDMEKQVLRRKLKWAGHVSRMKYDRWAKIVSEWDPRGSARPRGRPPKRWADDIKDSIKIFIHNEALRGNLGHGRRRIGILEARRAWSTVGRDRVTWRSLVRSIQDGN
uniref:Uncharacterized protein n=1 Tax=Caenorhabditis japonica TaxID=281687 RepID=A0A8R1IA47_CAEJA